MQCLCVLAQEIETKEQLSLLIVQPLLFALDVRLIYSKLSFREKICHFYCYTHVNLDMSGGSKHYTVWTATYVQPQLQVIFPFASYRLTLDIRIIRYILRLTLCTSYGHCGLSIVCLLRCESGQEAILAYCNPKLFFATVHHHHSGDPDVMRQCRRLELALMQFGWRGNVEELITREMRNELIDAEYTQESEHVVNTATATASASAATNASAAAGSQSQSQSQSRTLSHTVPRGK